MKSSVDLRLLEEVQTFALRFRCDDCAHFDEDRERCGHAYPVAPHRAAPLVGGDVVLFCKDFELAGVSPEGEP